jgi:hypothetical protein
MAHDDPVDRNISMLSKRNGMKSILDKFRDDMTLEKTTQITLNTCTILKMIYENEGGESLRRFLEVHDVVGTDEVVEYIEKVLPGEFTTMP